MSDRNPYEPPVQSPKNPDQSGWPVNPQEKPTAIKVFGILNVVFGVLGMCGTIFSGVVLFATPPNPNFPNPTLDLMNSNLVYRGFILGSLALGFIFIIVLILSGVGLLQNRNRGRVLGIWYGWYAIIAAVAGTIMNVVFLLGPLMQQANQGPESAAALGGFIGGLFGGLIGLIYPVLLLVFMNKQNVIDALD